MRPQIIELDANGTSDPIQVDYEQTDFKLGLQVDYLNSGDGTATVQCTMAENPRETNRWYDVLNMVDIANSSNNGAQGNIFFPVTGVRLVTAGQTTGEIRLTVLQGRSN